MFWQLSMKLEPKIFYWNKHNGVNLKLYQKVVYKYNIKHFLMIFIPFKDTCYHTIAQSVSFTINLIATLTVGQ